MTGSIVMWWMSWCVSLSLRQVLAEDGDAGRALPHGWVPVLEDAGRVVLPQPGVEDPQRQRRVLVEVHPQQLRRRGLGPRVDRHDVLVGDQPGDVSVGVELVDERLGLGDVDLAVHQVLVDVVQAHPTEFGVGEAAEGVEGARVAGGLGGRDVLVASRRKHRSGAVGSVHLVIVLVGGHGRRRWRGGRRRGIVVVGACRQEGGGGDDECHQRVVRPRPCSSAGALFGDGHVKSFRHVGVLRVLTCLTAGCTGASVVVDCRSPSAQGREDWARP